MASSTDAVIADGDELGRHAAGGGVLAELEELRDFLALLRLHLLEDLARAGLPAASPSRSAAASGSISSTMSAARSESSDSTIDTWTFGSSSSSASAATSSSSVSKTASRSAGGRSSTMSGDVGRVQLREAFVDDLQLDAARRVRLEKIDVLPRDDARRNPCRAARAA